MGRTLTDKFQINGVSMYAPDEEPTMSYEDIDGSDTGRTLDGVMHRYPVRYKVGKWEFKYAQLTEAEKNYMENLFPNTATFSFTHPSRLDANTSEITTCYRSNYSITWKSATKGIWRNYEFNIIEV